MLCAVAWGCFLCVCVFGVLIVCSSAEVQLRFFSVRGQKRRSFYWSAVLLPGVGG